MVIESMKQKLIFSDMVEMRKIIKGAVRMMEAYYEAKMPSDEKNKIIAKQKRYINYLKRTLIKHFPDFASTKIDKFESELLTQSQLTNKKRDEKD